LNYYSAEAHHILGVTLWESGEKDAAIAELKLAIALEPDSPIAKSQLQRYEKLLGDSK
jgi:hypothetical protein